MLKDSAQAFGDNESTWSDATPPLDPIAAVTTMPTPFMSSGSAPVRPFDRRARVAIAPAAPFELGSSALRVGR